MTDMPPDAAKSAGLIYVNDQQNGLSRRRAGSGFQYISAAGSAVRDPATLDRIRRLAIPPAWRSVWICANPRGHLQATGRDARGRKQHRYHPDFRAHRDAEKFDHMTAFAQALPALRAALEKDRRRQGLPREKVLATIVHLLDTSLIRIGNDEYAANNKSYGLTTLLDKHATVTGDELRFCFLGKSGKTWNVRMRDRRVAKVIKAVQDLPGQRLFQYLDGSGTPQEVHSTDVNAYLREISGRDISAKDFRTWAGTVLAGVALAAEEASTKTALRDVIAKVAARLGNTPAICRKCYIHPRVIELFVRGDLRLHRMPNAQPRLSPEERAVLAMLRRKGPRSGNTRVTRRFDLPSRLSSPPLS